MPYDSDNTLDLVPDAQPSSPRPVRVSRRPRTKKGVRLEGVDPRLVDFAAENDLLVTSGRDAAGVHVRNSAHGGGGAIDFRTTDRTPAENEGVFALARAAGLGVLDERAPNAHSTGPHGHISVRRAAVPAPKPTAAENTLDRIPDAEPENTLDLIPDAQDVSRGENVGRETLSPPDTQIPSVSNKPGGVPATQSSAAIPPGAGESPQKAPASPPVTPPSTTPQPSGVSEQAAGASPNAPANFPRLNEPGYADALGELIKARGGVHEPADLRDMLEWLNRADEMGDLTDPAFRAQVVAGHVTEAPPAVEATPTNHAATGVRRTEAPRSAVAGARTSVDIGDAAEAAAKGSVTDAVLRHALTEQGYGDVADAYINSLHAEGKSLQDLVTGKSLADEDVLSRAQTAGGKVSFTLTPEMVGSLRALRRQKATAELAPTSPLDALFNPEKAEHEGFALRSRLAGMNAEAVKESLRNYQMLAQFGSPEEKEEARQFFENQAEWGEDRRDAQRREELAPQVRARVEGEAESEHMRTSRMGGLWRNAQEREQVIAARTEAALNEQVGRERMNRALQRMTVNEQQLRKDVRAGIEADLDRMATEGSKGGQEYASALAMSPPTRAEEVNRRVNERTRSLMRDFDYVKQASSPTDSYIRFGVLAQRFRDNPLVLIPLSATLMDLANSLDAREAQQRVQEGRGTEADRITLAKVQAGRNIQHTFWEGVGAQLIEQPAFWGEFYMTGGMGDAIETTVEQGLKREIREGIRAVAGNAGLRRIAETRGVRTIGNIAARTAATVASGAARTATVGLPRVANDYVQNRMQGQDGPTAFVHSVLNQAGEYISEQQGEVLELVPGVRRLQQAMRPLIGKLEAGGYHGVAGEIFEERWKDLYDLALGLQAWEQVKQKWSSVSNWGTEAVAFGAPGVGQHIATEAYGAAFGGEEGREVSDSPAGQALVPLRARYAAEAAKFAAQLQTLQTSASQAATPEETEHIQGQIADVEEERKHYAGLVADIDAHHAQVRQIEQETTARAAEEEQQTFPQRYKAEQDRLYGPSEEKETGRAEGIRSDTGSPQPRSGDAGVGREAPRSGDLQPTTPREPNVARTPRGAATGTASEGRPEAQTETPAEVERRESERTPATDLAYFQNAFAEEGGRIRLVGTSPPTYRLELGDGGLTVQDTAGDMRTVSAAARQMLTTHLALKQEETTRDENQTTQTPAPVEAGVRQVPQGGRSSEGAPEGRGSAAARSRGDVQAAVAPEGDWQQFPPESGTLGVPRAEMPQIASEYRGAMVQFLKGRGITHEQEEVAPATLKPTQREFSPAKVEKARTFEGPNRSILVSSDGYVLDGHHQWKQALEDAPREPYPVIRFNAPIRELLPLAHEFPSSFKNTESTGASEMLAQANIAQSKPIVEAAAEPTPVQAKEPHQMTQDEFLENYERVGLFEPPRRSKYPHVDFEARDLQDSGKHVTEDSIRKDYADGRDDVDIYEAYIPIEDLPSAKLAEAEDPDNGGYDWDELRFSRGRDVPPIKVRVDVQGKLHILDGNHRLEYWEQTDQEYIPAWVVDVDGHRASIVKALKEGKDVPPEVLADYPDLQQKYAPLLQGTEAQGLSDEDLDALADDVLGELGAAKKEAVPLASPEHEGHGLSGQSAIVSPTGGRVAQPAATELSSTARLGEIAAQKDTLKQKLKELADKRRKQGVTLSVALGGASGGNFLPSKEEVVTMLQLTRLYIEEGTIKFREAAHRLAEDIGLDDARLLARAFEVAWGKLRARYPNIDESGEFAGTLGGETEDGEQSDNAPDRRGGAAAKGGEEGSQAKSNEEVEEEPAAEEYVAANPLEAQAEDPPRVALGRQFAQAFINGRAFRTITEARKHAASILGRAVEAGTQQAKDVDEAIEIGTGLAARETVRRMRAAGETDGAIYESLVNLYTKQQPNLSVRTSTSAVEQAYSSPAPLAFVASRLAGINRRTTFLDNSAGNGMLGIEAAPEATVLNEKNAARFHVLEALFPLADVRQGDALTLDLDHEVDRYIANPPFGVVKDDKGNSREFEPVPNWKTSQIDHAIAFAGLAEMSDRGRAVLIVGSVKDEDDPKKRADQYDAKAKRLFYYHLYRNYNVVDHFTVSGDLYERQGAGWPVDVIVIDGRGKSERKLPTVDVPRVYKSWADLAEVLNGAQRDAEVGGVDAGDRPEGSGDAVGRGGTGARGTGVEGRGDVSGVSGGQATEHDRGTSERAEGSGVRNDEGDAVERGPAGNTDDTGIQRSGESADTGEPANADEAGGTRRAGVSVAEQGLRGQPAGEAARRGDQSGNVAGARAESSQREKIDTTKSQVPYAPASTARGMGTLTPVNMATAAQDALDALIKRLGGVRGDDTLDRFVADRLGYDDVSLVEKHFGAEQVDAIALAIDNIERGAGMILGDATGIGKGRPVAAVMEYARRQNRVPIFVTEKPNLYKDIVRDLADIGAGTIEELRDKILMTNAALTVPLNDDIENPVSLKTPDAKTHNAALAAVFENDIPGANGYRLPKGKQYLFTTYSQMQKIGGATMRQKFLHAISEGAIIVFDESHNAGGTEASGWNKKDKATGAPQHDPLSRAGFAREIISRAHGVFYSSATFAKRPSVMDLYSKTDMSKSVSNVPLAEMIAKGGVPLQQIVSSMLVESGQMLRRERSFEGIEYATAVAPVDQESAETVSSVMKAVFDFDKVKKEVLSSIREVIRENAEAIGVDPATGAMSANSTSFSSILHNLVDQMLLSLKMEAAIEHALDSLRADEKPVITVAFTMGSFLQQYAEEFGLQSGEAVGLNFGDMLKRYLDRTRDVTYRRPDGTKYRLRLTDEQLGPRGVALYDEAVQQIQEADWSKMPVSPIDYIKYRIESEVDPKTGRNYKVGEITGRTYALDYTEHFKTNADAPPAFRRRSQKDKSIKGRIAQIVGFNEGSLDVMILNQAGSTGLSLHASERVSDQRPRHMIVAQPERNIDTHMQLLGRVHRTGQVVLPRYTQLVADIPSEKRPAAVLAKKMASLNANTTAARGSKFKAESVVDFMNSYGDDVALQLMQNNHDLHERLGEPLLGSEGEMAKEDAARKVTGRLPILTLAEQESVYDELEQEYNDLIERLNALGENALEAQTLALDAKTIKSTPVFDGTGDRPFERGAVAEDVDVKRLRKPYSTAQVLDLARTALTKRFSEAKATEPSVEGEDLTGIAQAGEHLRDYQRDAVEAEFDAFLAKELESIVSSARKGESEEEAASRAEQRRRVTETRHREVLRRWKQAHRRFYIGQTVQVVSPLGELYGVITDIHRSGRTQNPAALGAWKLQVALADAARAVPIPFSKILPEGVGDTDATSIDDFAGENYSVADTDEASIFDFQALKRVTVPVLEAFERGQSVTRERRVIITGNILAGFGRFEKSRGQIVNFTDSEGNLRQGILMPKDFDVAKALDEEPVTFRDATQIMQFLDSTPGLVASADGHFKIVKQGGNFKFSAPKARIAQKYWGNRAVLDAAGQDFVTRGDAMTMVVSPHTAEAIITAALEQGWTLHTSSHKGRAREITGQGRGDEEEGGGEDLANPRRATGDAQAARQINAREWWHVPPEKAGTYAERGKFYSPSFKAAELYNIRADAKPERVLARNPLVGSEDSVEQELLGRLTNLPTSPEWIEARLALDKEMAEAARRKGYDAILKLTPEGFEKYKETGKVQGVIELSTLHELADSGDEEELGERGDLESSRGRQRSISKLPDQQGDVPDFSLSERAREILARLGIPIHEKTLSTRLAGLFKQRTKGVRVQALPDVFTVAHEAAHAISDSEQIGERVIADTTRNHYLRQDLTRIYTEFYPKARASHALRKRVEEGLAVLLEEYLYNPLYIQQNYPRLVNAFIKQGGTYNSSRINQLLAEMASLIGDYVRMTPEQQFGARIARSEEVIRDDSGFAPQERTVYEVFNNVEPLRRLGLMGEVSETRFDPDVAWVQWKGRAAIFNEWLRGQTGLIIPKLDGSYEVVKGVSVNRYLDIVRDHLKEWDWFLVARRVVSDHNRIADLRAEAADPTTDPERAAEAVAEAEEIAQVLANDQLPGLPKAVAVVTKYADQFKEAAKLYDQISRAVVELSYQTGLITREYRDKLHAGKGYAPFFKLINDEMRAGRPEVYGTTAKPAAKGRAFRRRGGSEQMIISPTFNQMTSIAEQLSKGMENIIWRRVLDLAEDNPEIARRFEPVSAEEAGADAHGRTNRPDIVTVMVDGTRQYRKVAPELLAVAQNLHPAQLGWVAKIFVSAARLFQIFTTGVNPFFGLFKNLFIDQPTAALNTRTGYKPYLDAAKTLPAYLSMVTGAHEAGVGAVDPAVVEQLEKFLALGGKRMNRFEQTHYDEAPEKVILGMLGKGGVTQKLAHAVEAVMSVGELPNNLSEIMTRFAEYSRDLAQGADEATALYHAAEVTTNFLRVGHWGGQYGQAWVRSVPYMPSSFNVLYKLARQFKDDPARVAFVFAAVSVATLATTLALLKFLDDDKYRKQRKEFMDAPVDDLQRFVYIPNPFGEHLFRLPVPNEMGALVGIVQLYAIQHYGGNKVSRDELFDTLAAPLPEQMQWQKPGRAAWSLVPKLIGPTLQTIANQQTYPNIRPIVPDRLKDQEPYLQSSEYTTAVSKWLAYQLRDSPIAPSPMKLDYWIRAQLGPVGALLTTGKVQQVALFDQEREYQAAERAFDRFKARQQSLEWQYKRLEEPQAKYSPEEQKDIVTAYTLFEKMGTVLSQLGKASRETTPVDFKLKERAWKAMLRFDELNPRDAAQVQALKKELEEINNAVIKHLREQKAPKNANSGLPEGYKQVTAEQTTDLIIERRAKVRREIKLPPPVQK